jgi:hypothetical protein
VVVLNIDNRHSEYDVIFLLSVKVFIMSVPTSAFGLMCLETLSAKLQAAQLKSITVTWYMFYVSYL